ncbi:putative conserved secreted protein [Synechococcus sp. A15-127]|uniref:DUF3887 domain-containing protein n=1 Tax=Synechococcus sp. A15-127 TaxID=1050624 RepID=UPI0016441CA4|nr:DUF3887 domain-containing protein [Synechococcus sp. A15-127]QNI94183.1 putative conserved secreted protein [Synechococcus sp. A15-127]
MNLLAGLLATIVAAAPVAAQQTNKTDLTPAQSTAATELLLQALKERQAAVIHSNLAESVRSSIDVATIQKRLDSRRAILSTKVIGVTPGYRTTTVDAVVSTADGEKPILLMLDDDGKLLAWKWAGQIEGLEATALDFVKDLAAGRWVVARSKLSLDMQSELAPGDLERKWTKLQKVSGGFRQVKDAVIANQGGEQQLVLVAVEFVNTTSNLFVIFDGSGRIINVDISEEFV